MNVITLPGVEGVPKLPRAAGPALQITNAPLVPLVAVGISTTGFCVILTMAEPEAVPVTTGGAPGPTCETRSSHCPFQSRGTSVPLVRFESAMYSMSSKVTEFPKLFGSIVSVMELNTPGALIASSCQSTPVASSASVVTAPSVCS